MQEYTPIIRAALLAALETPSHSLKRAQGGFIALEKPVRTSGTSLCRAFTRRAVNWLEREGLAKFDEPDFPRAVTLTEAGITAARELKAELASKTMRA